MNNKYRLCRAEDGHYYAELKGYPQVGCPESYGTREHAMTYIANRMGLTLEEYRKAGNSAKTRTAAIKFNDREQEMLVNALDHIATEYATLGVGSEVIAEYRKLLAKISTRKE